eukprot:g5277.t1
MQKEDGARFAVSLVHEGALRLELPHATTASAMAVLSRYMNGCAGNASGAASHPLLVAMACVLVSAKAHDLNPMPSVRSIVIVFCHVARARMLAKARGGVVAPQSSSSTPPPRPMSLLSSQHQVWCNEIRNMEMSILKAVGFNLYAILQEHAHSYLLSILRSLKIDTMEKENQKLIAGAWTFLNDAWYFNETSPGVVAAAALLSSSQSCGRALPVGWSKGVSDASIQKVISSIKSLRQSKTAIPFWIPHAKDDVLMLGLPVGTTPVGHARNVDVKATEVNKKSTQMASSSKSMARLVPRQLKTNKKKMVASGENLVVGLSSGSQSNAKSGVDGDHNHRRGGDQPDIEIAAEINIETDIEIAAGMGIETDIEIAAGIDIETDIEIAAGIDFESDIEIAAGIDIETDIEIAPAIDIVTYIEIVVVTGIAAEISKK